MDMIVHQDPRKYPRTGRFYQLLYAGKKILSIPIISKDRNTIDPSHHDMVKGPRGI
jgi:hypothetical protein